MLIKKSSQKHATAQHEDRDFFETFVGLENEKITFGLMLFLSCYSLVLSLWILDDVFSMKKTSERTMYKKVL